MYESNDHRVLGQALDLFHLQDEAPGMVFWHPRGFAVLRALEDAVRALTHAHGFSEVRTPQLLRQSVWEQSGHLTHFAGGMFVVEDGERTAALKPVSCPGHLYLARRGVLSYRDLPLRLSELGIVHRAEPSGTLHGLFRLRQFTQDDGHVLCAEEHVATEVERFCRSLSAFYRALGFDDTRLCFATRPASRVGDDARWDRAEASLEAAARRAGLAWEVHPGDGAFYGPKLEFVLRDRAGRSWQCGTVQLDLNLAERFDVTYADERGCRRHPALLHRAVLGSLERFIGVLLEHGEGALPGCLAPIQVAVLPVHESQLDYAVEIAGRLEALALRPLVGTPSTSLARRIAEAHAHRVPAVLVVGRREAERRSVTRRRGSADSDEVALDDALRALGTELALPAVA